MKKEQNEISLAKFIARYELLVGEDLKKITHEDAKILFPDLKRTTFELIRKNPELLYNGQVVLVNDGRKTIPYFVPREKDLDDEASEFEFIDEEKKPTKREYVDYTSMSVYELKQFLHEKFSTCQQRTLAKRELLSRGVVHKKKYVRCKEKNKWNRIF